MSTFESAGAKIHFIDEGAGPPILLVHGFASNLEGNWRATGVIAALIESGRRVIALDCRGHGKSDKPHDPKAYGVNMMANDAIALLDHLGIPKADLMGYSMGGYIATSLVTGHPDRFHCAIIGGAGERVLAGDFDELASTAIADALASVDGATNNPIAKQFRTFAETLSGNDLKALSAVMRSGRPRVDPARLANIKTPVLVLAGASDPLVGNVKRFSDAIPGSELAQLPGDHLTVFVGEGYRRTVLAYLAKHSPVPVA
jgi:pimeloyl-ACP methyl ester carboxylesterase